MACWWSPKRRRLVDVVRNVALLPGPFHIWVFGWVGVLPSAVTAGGVCLWPYSVGVLVNLVTFLGSLHWPSAGSDLGSGGTSYLELLMLYELWAGERLQIEKAVLRCKRVDRSISVSAVSFGPGIDIRRSYKLLGAMLRALGTLLGGLGRFFPCGIGSNHCRVGTGLTSRPRETSNVAFLDELLVLIGYPPSSGSALLEGTLLLRDCVTRFAHKVHTLKLLARCGVADLMDPNGGGSECFIYVTLVLPFLEGSLAVEDDDAGGRQLHDHLVFGSPSHDRTGIG